MYSSLFSVSLYSLRINVVLVWKNDFDKSLRRESEIHSEIRKMFVCLERDGDKRKERTKSLALFVII